MSWDKGFDFRGTPGYVTDPANCTYFIADAYPTTRNGVTFGWEDSSPVGYGADRSNTIDPRLAGINFFLNVGSYRFRVDLPASGTYLVSLAVGDATNAWASQYCQIRDNTTALKTVSGSTAAGYFIDAQGNNLSAAAWPGSNVAYSGSFASTIFRAALGQNTDGSVWTIAHIFISQSAGGGTTISVTDADSGSDSLSQLLVSLGIADSGSGADSPGYPSALVPISDSGAGTDTPSVLVAFSVTDSGTGADLASISVSIPVSDSGAGVDSAILQQVLVALADAGAASDSTTLSVSLSVSDTGSGADTISTIQTLLVALADSGSGVDSIGSISVSFGLTYAISEIDHNCLLNAGITALWNLVAGLGGTAFSNAAAYIGMGDSSTAATAAQTNLQAATNKFYQAMNTGYPSVSNQTITYEAIITGANANYAWNEFIVANSSGGTTALNRVVSAQGTKTAGQTWTVNVAITLS